MADINPILLIISIFIAYILGSIPFSYIFAKRLRGEDIRKKGSGNAGTSNALRIYGWKIGILTLVCDIGKGYLAASLGFWISGDIGLYIASICAVAGHNYSVFLQFKGGKGIACTTGVLLVIQPIPTIIIFGCCVIIVTIVKIMSVGSLIGLAASVITAFLLSNNNLWWEYSVLIIAVMGFWGHRENIVRLLHGDERKLNIIKK